LSRKISRRYPRPGNQATFETTDDSGPSGSSQAEWSEGDGVPPSPSTEYPEQFGGLALPSYYTNAEIDPIALKSLGYGPPINSVRDYLGPPPTESVDEPVMGDSSSQSLTESVNLADGTFMSQETFCLYKQVITDDQIRWGFPYVTASVKLTFQWRVLSPTV